MPYELIDAPAGDYRLARFFAQAVDHAYLNDPAGRAKFQSELGLDAKLISVGNTQVYVGTNAQHIVVTFRGSEAPVSLDGLKDWFLTNANNLLVLPEGRAGTDFVAAGVGARFHRGFLDALEAVWAPMVAAVDAAFSEKERPIWVCGHSLGGALAMLAAWRFERSALPVHQVYTFGAPMIGNAVAAQAFADAFAGRVFRVVDGQDLVPKLPTFSLTSNPYDHCPQEVRVGADATAIPANLAAGPEISAPEQPGIWALVMGQVTSHLMNNYIKQIEERCDKG